MNRRTWKWVLRHVPKPVEEGDVPYQVWHEDDSKDDHGVSRRGEQGLEPPQGSEPSTWQRWHDVRPVVPVNDDCLRERAVDPVGAGSAPAGRNFSRSETEW